MRMLIWWKAASLVPLAAVLAAANQTPAFRTQTQLVAINITVTDDSSAIVRGLSRQAFAVTEDGKPGAIAQFASDPLPLSLAIALDASGSIPPIGARRSS
jgi:hypothetical protein